MQKKNHLKTSGQGETMLTKKRGTREISIRAQFRCKRHYDTSNALVQRTFRYEQKYGTNKISEQTTFGTNEILKQTTIGTNEILKQTTFGTNEI